MLVIDKSSPLEYLATRVIPHSAPGTDPPYLVVLPGIIVRQNFVHACLRQGIPGTAFETITFDDLAMSVLDPQELGSVRMLDNATLTHLAVHAITKSPHGSLSCFQSLPLDNDDVAAMLLDEFNQYLRGSDACSLHNELVSRAQGLADPFARHATLQYLNAFKALTDSLQTAIQFLGPNIILSRSHLIQRAKELLPAGWPQKRSKIQEVLVASITVFDAGVLRFLVKIAETGASDTPSFNVRIFAGRGTYERIARRLSAANVPFQESGQESLPASLSASTLLEGRGTARPTFIAAPERRREVELVAQQVHQRLLEGLPPSEILLVARSSSRYLELVNEILPAYGIPSYVQTRRPYAHVIPYRFMKAALDLVARVAGSMALDWNSITDPLRLGFCLPAANTGWPLPGLEFIYLEECLAQAQHRMNQRGLGGALADWRNMAGQLRWQPPRAKLLQFLDWIEQSANNPPADSHDARNWVSKILGKYMYQNSCWHRESVSLRRPSPERFTVTELHPTHFATRIRNQLDRFHLFLEDLVETLKIPVSWDLIAQAFGEVFGARTYGLPEQDVSAIRMVDAANAAFLKAKHVYLMGMRSDEFPRKCPEGVFLSEQLRKAIDEPVSGSSAYLYLQSSRNDYESETDILEIALRTCSEHLTCSMAYLDERNNPVEWSAFIEPLGPEQDMVRISPDQWLPAPKRGETWRSLAQVMPPWVRQRLYCHHANRIFPQASPAIGPTDVAEIGDTVDADLYATHLKPRVARYLAPPASIPVKASEACFATCTLQAIAGPPFRSHEIDLHAKCPFKFYFYQFLFAWDGRKIDRDTIGLYSRRPHWKLGRLPTRLSYIYPASLTSDVNTSLIARWPNRTGDLKVITLQNLRQTLDSSLNKYDLDRLRTPFEDEWRLVAQETRDNITRNWTWVPSGIKMKIAVEPSKTVEVILPAHRVDQLRRARLILVYVNFSKQMEHLFQGKRRGGHQILCPDVQDPLLDYRLPLLLVHYGAASTDIAGALYVAQYNGERCGYYLDELISQHKGRSGYLEELPMPIRSFPVSQLQVFTRREWKTRLAQFQTAIINRIRQMEPQPDLEFTATPNPISCARCVYTSLCQLPRIG